MKNKAETKNEISTKIDSINDSINLMADCVKHLEKIRSYNYIASVDEEELQNVLSHLQKIEESIDKIKQPSKQIESPNVLIKAVGKNKKLWVSRPGTDNSSKPDNRRLPEPKFVSNTNLSKADATKERLPERIIGIKK